MLRGGRPKDIEITACHVASLAAASNCAFAVTGDVSTGWEMQRRKLDGLGLASVYTLLILEQTGGRPDELRSSVMPGVQGEAPASWPAPPVASVAAKALGGHGG